jgi:hypothetical protein
VPGAVERMVNAMLAVSEGGGGLAGWELGSVWRRAAREFGGGVASEDVGVFSIAMPVVAVHISSMGGVGSVQGTVKRGLSQRLCVLGSS